MLCDFAQVGEGRRRCVIPQAREGFCEARHEARRSPSMSCITSTWPSQSDACADADGGIASIEAISRASGGGMPSSTIANAPACLERFGVFEEALAASGRAALAIALHAMTAHPMHRLRRQPDMPHHRNIDLPRGARTVSANAMPPSSFTASAPPSLIRRPALRSASSGAHLVGEKRHVGDQQRAFAARATMRVW